MSTPPVNNRPEMPPMSMLDMELRKQGRRFRSDGIACGILLLLWLVVWAPRQHGPVSLRWDGSIYYILGAALAEGRGYRLLNEPGEVEVAQYPPLLPLIVAAHIHTAGTTEPVIVGERLRLFYFIVSGAYLLLAYAVVRSLLTPLIALSVIILTGLSSCGYLYLSDSLYAELPFALVSMLFLLCQRWTNQVGNAVLSGLLGSTAYLLRAAGVALLCAWIAESLTRGRWKQACLRMVIAAIPITLWQGHTWKVTGSEAYQAPAYPYQRAAYYYPNVTYSENMQLLDPFTPELGRADVTDVVTRLASSLVKLPLILGEGAWTEASTGPFVVAELKLPRFLSKFSNWPALSTLLMQICLIGVGCFILLGAILLARGQERLWVIYFALAVTLIVLTPWPAQYCRYLAVIAPLSLAFLARGLNAGGGWLAKQDCARLRLGRQAFVIVPLTLMIIIQAPVAKASLRGLHPTTFHSAPSGELQYRLWSFEPSYRDLDSAFDYIRRCASPVDVVATSMPHLAYLRTGLKAVLPPFVADPAKGDSMMAQVPVSYLVVDEIGGPRISARYAEPAARLPGRWRLVFRVAGGRTRVYRRMS